MLEDCFGLNMQLQLEKKGIYKLKINFVKIHVNSCKNNKVCIPKWASYGKVSLFCVVLCIPKWAGYGKVSRFCVVLGISCNGNTTPHHRCDG